MRVSLWDSLATPVSPNAELVTYDDRQFRHHTWSELTATAEGMSAKLRLRGVENGSRVGFILSNSFEAAASILGTWWAGGTVLSFPTPGRGVSVEDYVNQLRHLCVMSDAAILLVEDGLTAGLRQLPGIPPVFGFTELVGDGHLEPSFLAANDIAFVQYSSGSTSLPKGCTLTPRAIWAQLEMLTERLQVPDARRDRSYSWLPLSHDMGLFGGLLWPWANGLPLTLSTPTRFLRSPYTWLDECAREGITHTVGPSFGLSIALRAANRRAPSGPLNIQNWIIGSDPIEAGALDQAVDVLGPLGLKRSAFRTAYGMAEATLAVTMTRAGSDPSSMPVALDALYRGELRIASADERTARVVSSGPPMVGTELHIDGPNEVGEIIVNSTSLATGYLNAVGRTERSFPNGSLHTGDLGFIRDGELYVIGREDDMVSIGGRNVYTAAVEARLGQDDRIRSGSCAVVDVLEGGRRHLVVLAEPVDNNVDLTATAHDIRKTAGAEAGVGIQECIFVTRGSLPKSPSGKIQRFLCRGLVSEDGPHTLARIDVG